MFRALSRITARKIGMRWSDVSHKNLMSPLDR